MALGDLRNSGTKSNSNKMYENTYYSRVNLKGGSDGLRLGFSFRSGMIVVDISKEKEGFQFETLASCFLTPVKALTMYNQIQEFKNAVSSKSYKAGTAYGVNTGIGDVSTVLLIHQVDGDDAVTIGKVNSDGQYVEKFTYKFAKGYHYGITLSNIDNMSTTKKEFFDDIELVQFEQAIKSFAENSSGALGYTVIDLARYDYRGLSNKLNPIYDKLGIERQTPSTRNSENNFFSGSNGGFNRGTSNSTSLDNVMEDLPYEE